MDATIHTLHRSGFALFLRMFAFAAVCIAAIVLIRRFTS